MSKISDIKLLQNENGKIGKMELFEQIDKKQYALVSRLTLKLREMNFRFEQNFSWLIIIFTPSLSVDQIKIIGRVSGDSFCQVDVGADFSKRMPDEQLLSIIKRILIMLTNANNEPVIQSAINYIVEYKEKSTILYRSKKVGKYEVLFYIVVKDDNSETRIAKIVNADGKLLKEIEVPFLLDFVGKVYVKNGTIYITNKHSENEEEFISVQVD